MNSEEPNSPEAEHPFQSPKDASASHAEAESPTEKPLLITGVRLKWIWECLAFGLLICVGPHYNELLTLLQGSTIPPTPILPAVFSGVMIGIGLALLLNHATKEKFAQLQPGHWLFIVTTLTVVRLLLEIFVFDGSAYTGRRLTEAEAFHAEFLAFTPQAIVYTLITIFYIAILFTTRETKVWKGFAWIATFIYIAGAVVKLLLVTPWVNSIGPPQSFNTPIGMTFVAFALVSTVGPYVLGLIAVVGVLRDLIKDVPRDFYHYLGLVSVVIQPAIYSMFNSMAHRHYFGS